MTKEELKQFELKPEVNKYQLLLDGGVEYIEGIDDRARWEEVIDALNIMNFSPDDILLIKQTVAGMLLMGNFIFEKETHVTEKVKIQNRKILTSVSKLLKIDETKLEYSLTKRTVNAKGDSVEVNLTLDEATQA